MVEIAKHYEAVSYSREKILRRGPRKNDRNFYHAVYVQKSNGRILRRFGTVLQITERCGRMAGNYTQYGYCHKKTKSSREERWLKQNEAILAANQAVPSIPKPVSKAVHLDDPNLLLAGRLNKFFGLPAQAEECVLPWAESIPVYLKPETREFVSFGREKGYDYLHAGRSLLLVKEAVYRGKSPKQIAAEWMKAASIPSDYKLLMNDFVACCLRRTFLEKNDARSEVPNHTYVPAETTQGANAARMPAREADFAVPYSSDSSEASTAPTFPGRKKYYAALFGKSPVVFNDADVYQKMARQFPKAPMRIFDNRKEANAWLLEISNAPNIEKPGKKKKYYTVAQGAITGIFESVEMYEKATNGFHNALARSFRDRKAAEI